MTLPFPDILSKDHNLQVFSGLLICFGFAWITSLMNLSAPMGALMAGILIANSTSTQWLEHSLVPFRIFFLALFFISIGLQISVKFLMENLGLIITIVFIIFLINSITNAMVFRLLKETWANSIYAGALLSQIGEFSLVLCLVARDLKLVDEYWYQLTLTVVSVTMLLTAVWISIIRAFIFKRPSNLRNVWYYLTRLKQYR
jgi:CPA2 family monovalent cation:H+ antiporter-2